MYVLLEIRPSSVKFCGVTRELDVERCLELGVDAIGLNFVPTSPRHVSLKQAMRLYAMAPKAVQWVGVFVNPTRSAIEEVLEQLPLDCLQLHGEEVVDDYVGNKLPPILKSAVWRGVQDQLPIERWLSHRQDLALSGFLVDAYDPMNRGGTGKRANWDLLQPRPMVFREVSLILAGGLTPESVEEAVRKVGPEGLDVASGIEESPGVKSFEKMQRFMSVLKSIGFP